MERSLGVVIPAYRPDVDVLAGYVAEIHDALSPEVIRVELDSPAPGVRESLEGLTLEVGAVAERRGKGAAITDGFERLDTDILAFVDADGSTPVDSFARVITPVLNGTAALGVGSRRHPDATVTSHQTIVRRWLGDQFASIARLLLDADLYDYQCGAKAIDRDAWTAVKPHLHEPGFAWDVEVIAITAALGFRIAEIPVVWEDQPGSTVSPIRTPVALAVALLRARHRAKLLSDDPVHAAIAACRDGRPALVERGGWRDE